MRRWVLVLALIWAAALGAGDAPAQSGERRIALIIANGDYRSSNLIDLPGAERDAVAISAALQRAGFAPGDIVVERNLDLVRMRRAFSAFGQRLSALGQNGVGFVYYAGHGVADGDGEGSRNYLIPVDAELNSSYDYAASAFPVATMLDGMNRTRARTVIVVLDACRNMPLRGNRGMAAEGAPTNVLVAYSASPGQVAADDGLYARLLAEELVKPGAEIASVFRQVQYRVSATTRNAQRPRFEDGLTQPITLVFDAEGVSASRPSAEPAAAMPSRVLTGRWSIVSGQVACGSLGMRFTSLGDSSFLYHMGLPLLRADQTCHIESQTGTTVTCGSGVTFTVSGELVTYRKGGQSCSMRRADN